MCKQLIIMKKLVLMVVAAMIATMSVNAQNEDLKHEFGISYGAGVSIIGDGIGNAVGRGIWESLSGIKWEDSKQFGTLAAEYFYHLDSNPKLAFGGILAYAQYGEDVVKDSKDLGDRTRHYISVIPSLKYSWVNKNSWALYSKLGVGPMIMMERSKNTEKNSDETNTNVYFAYQVSVLGIEFGGKLRGFIEGGVGEQGIVLAGLKYKF